MRYKIVDLPDVYHKSCSGIEIAFKINVYLQLQIFLYIRPIEEKENKFGISDVPLTSKNVNKEISSNVKLLFKMYKIFLT